MMRMFKTYGCAVAVCAFLSACAVAPKGKAVDPNAQYLPEGYVPIAADFREYEAVVKNCMGFGFSRAECESDTSTKVCHASWPKGYCGRFLRITHYLDKYMD